ncbi:protein kinase [Hamiltosporidium tvaerminnensis]|uniref:Protein kinase n=1 Tax=Hamiltosporidium tvaerminnensis TaxID=1176355 RepID=A0A4Q9LZ05_9MICR|nr:protein kinase [Hamiltosporidium tvaerminnensis]
MHGKESNLRRVSDKFLQANEDISIYMETGAVKVIRSGKLLGRGGYAEVYEGYCIQDKKMYALKFSSTENASYLKKEAEIYKRIGLHGSIIRFHGYGEYKDFFVLLLELGSGSLSNFYKFHILNDYQIAAILKQLIDVLTFIHNKGIIYNDLKGNNILINEDLEIKIFDFGLSCNENSLVELFKNDGKKRDEDYSYISPEIRNCKFYTNRSDLWSLGALLWTLYSRENFLGDLYSENLSFLSANMLSLLLQVNPLSRAPCGLLIFHGFFDYLYNFLIDISNLPDFYLNISDNIKLQKIKNEFIYEEYGTSFHLIFPPNNYQIRKNLERKIIAFQQQKYNKFYENTNYSFIYSKYLSCLVGFSKEYLYSIMDLDYNSLRQIMNLKKIAINYMKGNLYKYNVNLSAIKNNIKILDKQNVFRISKPQENFSPRSISRNENSVDMKSRNEKMLSKRMKANTSTPFYS